MTLMPHELDVVRLNEPIDNWPAGTQGTLIEVFDTDGIVEVEAGSRWESIVVPYSAMTVVWRFRR